MGCWVSQQSSRTKYAVISGSFPRHPIKRTFLNAPRQHLRASDRSFFPSRRLFPPAVQIHGLKTTGRTTKNATRPLWLCFHSRRLAPQLCKKLSAAPQDRLARAARPGAARSGTRCRSVGSQRWKQPRPLAATGSRLTAGRGSRLPAPLGPSPTAGAPPSSPCPTCRPPPGAAGAAEQQPEVQRDPERTGAQQHQPVSHWPPPQPAPSPPRRDYGPARRNAAPPLRAAARPGRAELRCPAAAGSCSPAPAPAGGGGAGGGGGRLQSPECRGRLRPAGRGRGGRAASSASRRRRGSRASPRLVRERGGQQPRTWPPRVSSRRRERAVPRTARGDRAARESPRAPLSSRQLLFTQGTKTSALTRDPYITVPREGCLLAHRSAGTARSAFHVCAVWKNLRATIRRGAAQS